MTAPYTTDADAVQPRRVRSHPATWLGTFPWRVGCGHAASTIGSEEINVVRLSDGWSWRIPIHLDRQLYTSLGVTCDEVFAYGKIDSVYNVARIRIDSLGPGTPPD